MHGGAAPLRRAKDHLPVQPLGGGLRAFLVGAPRVSVVRLFLRGPYAITI